MAAAIKRDPPLYVALPDLAAALGVSQSTVHRWIREGRARAIKMRRELHYTDDRPRKPNYEGEWRIELSWVFELLEKAYAGSPVPPSIKAKLTSLGKSPKGPSSK